MELRIAHLLSPPDYWFASYLERAFEYRIKRLSRPEAEWLRKQIVAMRYEDFMRSLYWRTVAHQVKRNSRFRCSRCLRGTSLEAHHKTYEHHGMEHLFMEDLVCLCRRCHAFHHKPQRIQSRIDSIRSAFRRALLKH